ncbi:MAG: HAMP domain-containing histidine kinase [Bacteroides sp.]|nr:HAMP domain-containing histidine kinase [Bacteroides sp.]
MGLKRRISYQWRLFIPIAFGLCIIFGCIIFYQLKREADYRSQVFNAELDLIDNRILDAYRQDINLHTFLSFIQQFFQGSMFEGVRVSVYNEGRLDYSLGAPVLMDNNDPSGKHPRLPDDIDGVNRERAVARDDDKLYFFSTVKSDDGKVVICTAMPYNDQVHDVIDIDHAVWLIIGLSFIAILIIVYFATRVLSRNVLRLREFAMNAISGETVKEDYEFPRNELGDISRQILKFYHERDKSLQAIKKERMIAVHAIEEKAKISRQLTNNINHEIKTPVGIIKGYLDSILADPDMDAATRTRFLERMASNVDRLTTLLNDVSTMTRLENGADMISVECVNMHDLVYQIDYDLPANNLAGNMKFKFDIPLDCEVTGNYSLLQGMVCGLIKNAAMHSGGTEIGMKLISENERFYVFSFFDNGNGVGEEHIPHLFERFYRVDTGRSRKMGGTGLGLPIVKSTVMSLGGTISVHNRSVGGLEYIFTLPKCNSGNTAVS